MEKQRYSEEAVRRILEQASALQLKEQTDTFSRDQLVEMAEELDISPEYVEKAEAQWLTEQEQRPARQEIARPARARRRERRGFQFAPVLPILLFFLFMSTFAGPWPFFWIIIPMLVWSFGRGHCGQPRRDTEHREQVL